VHNAGKLSEVTYDAEVSECKQRALKIMLKQEAPLTEGESRSLAKAQKTLKALSAKNVDKTAINTAVREFCGKVFEKYGIEPEWNGV
jgi:hypothetical protein